MSHLTDLELIAAIEDIDIDADADRALPAPRQRHLDACASCRGRAEDLRAVIVETKDAPVPEPSPLFWQHFSARVRQGLDGVEPGHAADESRLAGWLAMGSVRWAAGAALVVALMVAGVWQVSAPSKRTTLDVNAGRTTDASASPQALEPSEWHDPDADPAWAVVRTVADRVEWNDDAVADIGVQSDAIETVARTLSPEERTELVKLLLAEAKRPGA